MLNLQSTPAVFSCLHQNLSFSEQRICFLAFIQNCFHAVISTNIGLFSMVKFPLSQPPSQVQIHFLPKIFILGSKPPFKFLLFNKMTKNHGRLSAVFQKKHSPPGAVFHHVLLSIGYLAEPKWRCAPFTERKLHGMKTPSVPSVFTHAGSDWPGIYSERVRTQTAKVGQSDYSFSGYFCVSNRNSKYYTENQELVTHRKKTEKTNVKYNKPWSQKGSRPSAIAKRKGPTCQPQPPIKPDSKKQDIMVDGIKLNQKIRVGQICATFSTMPHESWGCPPFCATLPITQRHNQLASPLPPHQPASPGAENLRYIVDQMSGKPAVNPHKDLMNQRRFCWGTTFKWDRCGGHNNLKKCSAVKKTAPQTMFKNTNTMFNN